MAFDILQLGDLDSVDREQLAVDVAQRIATSELTRTLPHKGSYCVADWIARAKLLHRWAVEANRQAIRAAIQTAGECKRKGDTRGYVAAIETINRLQEGE